MKKLKKEKKSKKKKRKRSRSKSRSPSPPPKQVILPPGAPSMEELRRRKAQREAKARQKTYIIHCFLPTETPLLIQITRYKKTKFYKTWRSFDFVVRIKNCSSLILHINSSQAVMDRINGVVAKTEPIVEEETDERKRTYNNAFNPALNRKSKKYDY